MPAGIVGTSKYGVRTARFEDYRRTHLGIFCSGPDQGPQGLGDRLLVINLRDECAPGHFERVLEVVPADESQRAGSRERWKTYKAAGLELSKHDM